AQRHAPAVSDVQRPGRIDAAELDLQPLALTNVAGAVAARTRRHVGHQPAKPVIGEPEVHVSVVGLGAGGAPRDPELFGYPCGDDLGVLAQVPGELQAGRARVVAVAGDLRPTQLEVRDLAFDAQPSHRLDERLLDVVAHAA